MEALILGLLSETSVHPGSGRSLGALDLPVAREAATDYPVVVGSSLKGAVREKAEKAGLEGSEHIFGSQERAGDLIFSDARLLLLPVRSLDRAYRWVTSPHLLERFKRDMLRAGLNPAFEIPRPKIGEAHGEGDASESVFLEERSFKISGNVKQDVIEAVGQLIRHEDTKKRLQEQVLVLADDDFTWFARYGLQVQARNVLEDETKKSKNLWYEESLPPDTLMYSLVAARRGGGLSALKDRLFADADPYLQLGGNETVGHGWFSVNIVANGRGAAK